MKIIPISLKEANTFITSFHRHHMKVQGHKFSIGLKVGDNLVGVAICGRPVSRHLDNGFTIEVTRMCTDGTKNACSKLYSACAKSARELGYDKIVTYILESESGGSLIASGWACELEGCGGKKWVRSDGTRSEIVRDLFGEQRKYPDELKTRWGKILRHEKTTYENKEM